MTRCGEKLISTLLHAGDISFVLQTDGDCLLGNVFLFGIEKMHDVFVQLYFVLSEGVFSLIIIAEVGELLTF